LIYQLAERGTRGSLNKSPMPWFKRTPPKHPQEIQVPRVQFVGEQDGPSEQLLKELTEGVRLGCLLSSQRHQ